MEKYGKIRYWIEDMPKRGKATFTQQDVDTQFPDMSRQNISNALSRLVVKKKIQSVWRGFWVIVPNPNLNPDNVVKSYRDYISFSDGESPSKAVYLANVEEKMQEEIFLNDTQGLLRPSLDFEPQEAWKVVKERLIESI